MKIQITKTVETEVFYIAADCGVRYWEDASVDGVEDINGDMIPCREGMRWKPVIEIESGRIINWKDGVTADIHFKICDDGTYTLLTKDMGIVKVLDDYVPRIMSPEENGFGDYVIMKVNRSGIIQNWKKNNISDFND